MTDGPTPEIHAVEWGDPVGVGLRTAQQAEIEERYGTPDSEPGPKPSASDIAVFLVAYLDGVPVACGGLRPIDAEHGEIKRMYVIPERRGSGISTAVLRALEAEARGRGWNRLVLETGPAQPDAIRFYEREGYAAIPNFGYYAGSSLSLCYAKDL